VSTTMFEANRTFPIRADDLGRVPFSYPLIF
jgi:hypothetical protein